MRQPCGRGTPTPQGGSHRRIRSPWPSFLGRFPALWWSVSSWLGSLVLVSGLFEGLMYPQRGHKKRRLPLLWSQWGYKPGSKRRRRGSLASCRHYPGRCQHYQLLLAWCEPNSEGCQYFGRRGPGFEADRGRDAGGCGQNADTMRTPAIRFEGLSTTAHSAPEPAFSAVLGQFAGG